MTSVAPLVTRLVPILAAVGAVAGVGFGVTFGHLGVAAARNLAASVCRDALGLGRDAGDAPSAEVATCVPPAIDCRAAKEAAESQARVVGDQWVEAEARGTLTRRGLL